MDGASGSVAFDNRRFREIQFFVLHCSGYLYRPKQWTGQYIYLIGTLAQRLRPFPKRKLQQFGVVHCLRAIRDDPWPARSLATCFQTTSAAQLFQCCFTLLHWIYNVNEKTIKPALFFSVPFIFQSDQLVKSKQSETVIG